MKEDHDAWQGNYKYFTEAEMTCKCGCGGLPKHSLVRELDILREAFGRPLIVSSGFRCPAHNIKVAGTGAKGPHTTGLAVDIRISGRDLFELLGLIHDHRFTGIGLKQHGLWTGRYIHLDIIKVNSKDYPRPSVWTYA
jgi:uncharacterized protein YcbK (DUF882 family)